MSDMAVIILKLIISLEMHIPIFFIPLIPKQLDSNYNFYAIASS